MQLLNQFLILELLLATLDSGRPRRGDPLAQTFLVQREGGMFVTKADVFCQAKSDTQPLVVRLRTTLNGYPTDKIIPLSEAVIQPNDVQISEDGSLPTVATFPAPVYLEPDTEYALECFCDAPEYTLWVAELGKIDILGSRTISEQPLWVHYSNHRMVQLGMLLSMKTLSSIFTMQSLIRLLTVLFTSTMQN